MRYPLIIWFAVWLHATWGVCILIDPSVSNVTAIHSLQLFGIGDQASGIVYIVVSLLSAYSILYASNRITSVFCVIPQQFIVLVSAIGAAMAMYGSAFADGVVRPRAFIIADQSPAIITAVLHTYSVFNHFGHEFWKTISH